MRVVGNFESPKNSPKPLFARATSSPLGRSVSPISPSRIAAEGQRRCGVCLGVRVTWQRLLSLTFMTIITGVLLVATGLSMFDQLSVPGGRGPHMHQCAVIYEGEECEHPSHNLPKCVKADFPKPLTLTLASAGSTSSWFWAGGSPRPQHEDELLAGADPELKTQLPIGGVFGGLAPRAAVGSCALVGSSRALKGSGFGKEIDAHDIVVRVNEAPVAGYEADVGSRTDVRWTNAAHEGFREAPSEAVVGSQWSICPNLCEGSVEMTLAEGSDCTRDLRRVLDKKVHPLHPDFRCYAKQALPAAAGARAPADPTAGFEAALFLLHTCSALYLYGVTVEAGSGATTAAGAAAAAAAAAAAELEWYFPKAAADSKIPLADWNRTKAWVVGEWTYAQPLPDEQRDHNWSRRGLLSAAGEGRALLGGGKEKGAGAQAGEVFDAAGESECLAQLADSGLIVVRNRAADDDEEEEEDGEIGAGGSGDEEGAEGDQADDGGDDADAGGAEAAAEEEPLQAVAKKPKGSKKGGVRKAGPGEGKAGKSGKKGSKQQQQTA